MKNIRVLLACLTLTAAAACSDSTTPTAPTDASANASTASGTGATGNNASLKISAPVAVSPADGARVDSRRPALVVNNPAAPNAPSATLQLRFVLLNDAGARLHESALVGLGSGTTSYAPPNDLDAGRTFRWFAEVVWNGQTGAASATRSFSTPSPVVSAPATGNCPGGPLEIVTCQRGKFSGHMNDGELAAFMRAVAQNLNANGIGGGPYGVLRKAAGTNCGGYSCDIICAGQGGGQSQWDVLNDLDGAQSPTWSGPHSGGDIRVDACEVP